MNGPLTLFVTVLANLWICDFVLFSQSSSVYISKTFTPICLLVTNDAESSEELMTGVETDSLFGEPKFPVPRRLIVPDLDFGVREEELFGL